MKPLEISFLLFTKQNGINLSRIKITFFFRQKVKMQFNPLSMEASTFKKSITAKPALILSLPPLIPAKPSKKVNTISKYFKKLSKNKEKSCMLRLLPHFLMSPGKFLKSRRHSQNCKIRRSNTFKRLSQGKINQNLASI